MGSPYFSVIIPTYNRLPLLREALESVRVQSFKDFEIIVVDDGSEDGTACVVSEMINKSWGGWIQLRIIVQENLGPGEARNRGIREARGKFVAFLDSDDLWFPWTLEVYRKAIESSAEVSFVAGRETKVRAGDDLPRLSQSNLGVRVFPNYLASSGESIWIGTCSVAVRTDRLRGVGGFVSRTQEC